MKITFLKLRVTLFFAVFVLFISVFSNRITFAKNPTPVSFDVSKSNLPAEYVYTTNLSGISKSVFQKVNYQRKRKGLKAMFWHKELAKLAYDYSRKMAREDFFAHEDEDGNTIVERAEDYDLKEWRKIGENLFQSEGYTDTASVAVKGWLNSPSHRENIYDKDWTHTGIGVYETRDGWTYITQVFMQK